MLEWLNGCSKEDSEALVVKPAYSGGARGLWQHTYTKFTYRMHQPLWPMLHCKAKGTLQGKRYPAQRTLFQTFS
jgi:hypothetical protein